MFTLSDRGPTLAKLNLTGVDQVDFVPLKGKHDPALQGQGPYIAFDEFLFNHVTPARAAHSEAGPVFGPASHHPFGAETLAHFGPDPLHGTHQIA